MKYKFWSIRINVTKHDVTFATKGRGDSIYIEYKIRRMHHWYRNMQNVRSVPLKKSR